MLRGKKDANINFGNIPCKYFFPEDSFPCGKIVLSVGFLFQFYLFQ